jgi:hypothetical protein
MAGRQRTSFEKRQRERARQEKQAAKRARRQGRQETPEPERFGSLEPQAHDPQADDPQAHDPQAQEATEPDRVDTGEG